MAGMVLRRRVHDVVIIGGGPKGLAARSREVVARACAVRARDERPGIFAAGDVRSNSITLVASGVGEDRLWSSRSSTSISRHPL